MFYRQMLKECSFHGSPGMCTVLVRLYYEAVKQFGAGPYKKAQEAACED